LGGAWGSIWASMRVVEEPHTPQMGAKEPELCAVSNKFHNKSIVNLVFWRVIILKIASRGGQAPPGPPPWALCAHSSPFPGHLGGQKNPGHVVNRGFHTHFSDQTATLKVVRSRSDLRRFERKASCEAESERNSEGSPSARARCPRCERTEIAYRTQFVP
jgi:hypothetical protein